jgi:hypothetical protein
MPAVPRKPTDRAEAENKKARMETLHETVGRRALRITVSCNWTNWTKASLPAGQGIRSAALLQLETKAGRMYSGGHPSRQNGNPGKTPMTAIHRLSLAEQVAWQAEFIVNNVQQTDYQHKDNIDVDRGIYDCDCSGFVSYVLQRAAPGHYEMIPKEAAQPRPRAFKYYEFLHSCGLEPNNGWRQIELLARARRGDIIAWRFPVIEPHKDTGHVLFVAEAPAEADSGVFAVRVYDSAAQPHFDDARGKKKEGSFPTGVGSGFINFKVDGAGRPAAFQFAPADHFVTLPIAIARVEPQP